MLYVRDIRLPLSCPDPAAEAEHRALRLLGSPAGAVCGIARLSVDARRGKPLLVYTVAVRLADEREEPALAGSSPCVIRAAAPEFRFERGTAPLGHRPVVVGLGPAGLFAALLLAQNGYAPLVLERGPSMDRRIRAVERFGRGGPLDPEANVQFGEGGAGTFSDGKLTTRIRDPLCALVTRELLRCGAPPEIAWQQKPHIGTDKLRGVIAALRREIVRLGGEVRFAARLTGLDVQNGALRGVQTTAGAIPCEALILAVGHSARDTFAMLRAAGLPLVCKPFSVGVRAEHLQAQIEQSLYHAAAGHPALPRGEYQLSAHIGGRGVYTFCMCPGGQVVAAASEEGGVVTNGMSLHARNGKNANAAVVVGVDGSDFGADPAQAIDFQCRLEQAAFAAGGGAYAAPAETAASFLAGRGRLELGAVQPTYPRGVVPCDLGALLPAALTAALRAGYTAFGNRLAAYRAPDAVLTGLETRTSSPVRLLRGEDLQCTALPGLYPCGEGAGYAGGIMSAAVDGLRCAAALMAAHAPARTDA